MKFQSMIISRGSGSIGGLTASHNKGGNYFRARTTPTDPGTVFQTAVRTALASLVTLWTSVLSAAERAAWDLYAFNTPLLDQFGEPRTVTGLNMYARANVPRIQTGEPRQDAAPTVFDTGTFTPVAGAFSEAGQAMSLAFEVTDAWANEDDAAMIVQISRPQNPSINFFKGPWRTSGNVQGDGAMPPTSPANIATPFPIVIGQKMFAQVTVTRADGRLSVHQRIEGIVV